MLDVDSELCVFGGCKDEFRAVAVVDVADSDSVVALLHWVPGSSVFHILSHVGFAIKCALRLCIGWFNRLL